MTVAELIEELSKMDQDLKVSYDIGGKSIDVANVYTVNCIRRDDSTYQVVEIS
jgi:hypothetical protein